MWNIVRGGLVSGLDRLPVTSILRLDRHAIYPIAMARLDRLFTPMTDGVDLNDLDEIRALSKSVETDVYAAIVVPEPIQRYFHVSENH